MDESDLPMLRKWRNSNRNAFFNDKEISEEEHELWYENHKENKWDWMFVVTSNDKPMGCIGIRLVDDEWDIYNVIRGESGGNGYMGLAINKIIQYASMIKRRPITAKVLKGNKAINWYIQNGFVIEDERPDHFRIRFQYR